VSRLDRAIHAGLREGPPDGARRLARWLGVAEADELDPVRLALATGAAMAALRATAPGTLPTGGRARFEGPPPLLTDRVLRAPPGWDWSVWQAFCEGRQPGDRTRCERPERVMAHEFESPFEGPCAGPAPSCAAFPGLMSRWAMASSCLAWRHPRAAKRTRQREIMGTRRARKAAGA